MGIVNIDTHGESESFALNLMVAVENSLDIRVSSGSFKIAGVEYTLASDDVVTVTVDPTYETEVRGFLVKNVSTGNPEILVDEYVLDGVDVPYSVTKDQDYELFAKLYIIRVPAGTTDLSGLDLRVKRFLQLI